MATTAKPNKSGNKKTPSKKPRRETARAASRKKAAGLAMEAAKSAGLGINPFLNKLIVGDGITGVRSMPAASVHLIASDIPYGIAAEDWDVLHDNTNSALLGASPAQRRAGAVFKKRGKPINGWSESDRLIPQQYYDWCSSWAPDWYRVLVPGGSVFVFSGRRYAHRCICALEDAGFSFKDMLAWTRERAPHRAQRLSVVFGRRGDNRSAERWDGWRVGNLRPVFEPIMWFTKPYKIGTTIADNALDYGVGPYNEAALTKYVDRPDNILDIGFESNESGLHPTQKPVRLMQALIELATRPGQVVLDPFAGSGTTLAAAKALSRTYAGFESDPKFAGIARSRLEARPTKSGLRSAASSVQSMKNAKE